MWKFLQSCPGLSLHDSHCHAAALQCSGPGSTCLCARQCSRPTPFCRAQLSCVQKMKEIGVFRCFAFSPPSRYFLGFLFLTKNKEVWFCLPQLAELSLSSCTIYTRWSNCYQSCCMGPKQEWLVVKQCFEAVLGVTLEHKGRWKVFFSDTYAVLKEFPE